MKYRAEIDGLRALAVLPVIFFHAGFAGFSGGFVGGDVFFVISGYLITTIITSELEEGKFTIVNFYERRARRILPALFVMLLLCLPPAYLLLLPDPLENFGQSIVSTTLFSNNILLLLTAGYWDLASEYKPLLHTWSLAVEEQYYVIFPLLMIILWRVNKSIVEIVLLALAALSFAFALAESNKELAFFSLHTRGFEILSGALLCKTFSRNNYPTTHNANNFMSFLGFLLIIFSIILFDEQTPFPSFYTLAPVLGTCLIIHFTTPSTLLFRILAHRYATSIGLISYSAYLFHQPILSFLRASTKSDLSDGTLILAVMLTFVLARLSYRFVESPFRNRNIINTNLLICITLTTGISLIALGLWINSSNGFNTRLYEEYNPLEKSKNLSKRAWTYSTTKFIDSENPNVLVIGNSFGRDIVNVLTETYEVNNFNLVYSSTLSDCSLLEGPNRRLLEDSNLILFASAYSDKNCIKSLLSMSSTDRSIYFMGGKQFGYNLNWILRVDKENRQLLRNLVTAEFSADEFELEKLIPEENFISIVNPLIVDNEILITDGIGNLISDDRRHLTLSGARFIGEKVLMESTVNDFFDM